MKEQFVPYDIALKLKELGFDEECLGYFNNDKILKNILNPKDCNNTFLKGLNLLSAPLWQQAIDFLKKRKVLVAERWDGWEYGAYDWDDFIYCETKEEAILKAIDIC